MMQLSLIRKIVGYSLVTIWIATMLWQTSKPMPDGTNVSGASIAVSPERIQFLYDLTARDAWGRRVVDQQISDAIFAVIDGAQRFVVLDFFLFNDDLGASTDPGYRPLSRELTDRLIARKLAQPGLQVVFNTDPINTVYGGRASALLSELHRAGIDVVATDLEALRDSNPMYSAMWRMGAQWFGNSTTDGWLPDPFREQGSVTLRSWLALGNCKANQRGVIVADSEGGDLVGVITSANPHDASSLHSNVAWRFTGELALRAVESEIKIARLSGWHGDFQQPILPPPLRTDRPILEASFVTEGAIQSRLIEALNGTRSGDSIAMAMFYLSEQTVIEALEGAAARGVAIKLILDPNKDAFGMEQDGVPNRPVANQLVSSGESLEVRWYRTQGEQFHVNFVLIKQGKKVFASLGSANLTRRDLGNYNLEANINVSMPADAALAQQLAGYFERLWNNDEQKHIEYTAPFGTYKDDSQLTYWRYRVMERTGMSSF